MKLEKYRDKAPEGFSPEFQLELKERPAGGGLFWQVGDFYQLHEAWDMFRDGLHTTKQGFIDAYNERFGESRNASNFTTQFKHPWVQKLQIAEADLRQAEQRMRERYKESGGGVSTEAGDF